MHGYGELIDDLKQPKTILIIERRAEAEPILRAGLKGHFTIHAVDNGEAAIRSLAIIQADLIVLDLDLSGKVTGLETLLTINARLGRKRPPVVVISDIESSDLVARRGTSRLNVTQFISKPYGAAWLCGKVEGLINSGEIA